MERCPLCAPDLEPVLAESLYWQLVLNRNQSLLGKCFLVVRRHAEAVPTLTLAEWADLHRQLRATTHALKTAFQPAHFNYAFLQNQDRHVHLHVIPRYAKSRLFAGLVFDDPDYPAHYAVPTRTRHLAPEQFAALADQLRRTFVTQK